MRLVCAVGLPDILLHLLDPGLVHWTLLWLPLKCRRVHSDETRVFVLTLFVDFNSGCLTFFLTRWEMSETVAVEACPLVELTSLVDVLLICVGNEP